MKILVPVKRAADYDVKIRVKPKALKYINRVSDFLFVASRTVNERGKADVLWVPGKNR